MGRTMRGVSAVSDRLAWLANKRVRVQVASAEYLGEGQPKEFDAVYLETLPLGREYFFRFKLDNEVTRLIRTTSVVDITTL